MAERRRIAASVREELAAVGLPIAAQEHSDDPDLNRGVLITIWEAPDSGVIVEWRCHQRLAGPAMQAVMERRIDAPVLRHAGLAVQVMNEAITRILTSAGFTVIENPDDMDPMSLKVLQAPRLDTSPT